MDIEVKVKDDGVWLHFIGVNAAINIDKLIDRSGPITAAQLKAWKVNTIQEYQDREGDNVRDA